MQSGWSPASGTALLLFLLTLGSQPTLAQAGRTWVDPPAGTSAPPAAAAPQNQGEASREAAPPAQTAEPPPAALPSEPAAPPVRSAEPAERPPAPVSTPTPRSAQPSQIDPPQAEPSTETVRKRDPEEEERIARAEAAKAFAIDYLDAWSAPNDVALAATAEFYAPEILFHGRKVSMKKLHNEKRRFARRWPERSYRPRQDSMGATCNPKGEICTVHMVFDYTAANPKRRRSSQGSGALQLIVHFIGEKPVIVAEHSAVLNQDRKRNLALEGSSND